MYHTSSERGQHQGSSGDDKDSHKGKYKDKGKYNDQDKEKDKTFKKKVFMYVISLVTMCSNKSIKTSKREVRGKVSVHLLYPP